MKSKLMSDLVTIITPCYNSSEFIEESVSSVMAQTYDNWELIIIDDASTDSSTDVIRKLENSDDRISSVFLSVNKGVAAARNVAIKKAKGKYIAFLDSDDIWLPNKLEEQISFMYKGNIAFSFTAYGLMSQDGISLGKVIKAPKVMMYQDYLKNTTIGCLTVIVDFEQIGPFEMRDLNVSEDMVLWLDIMKRGFPAFGLNVVLDNYRVVGSSLSSNKRESAAHVWKVYREVEDLSIIYSTWCFINYAFNAIRKRL